jgi:hypothetical protein
MPGGVSSEPRQCPRSSLPVFRGRTRSVLLCPSDAASRLDELGFAGVCPIESPDPAATKIRVREATAIRSAKPPPVRAQGIEGARSGRDKYKKTCTACFFIFVVTEPPQSPVGGAGCAQINHPLIAMESLVYRDSLLCA